MQNTSLELTLLLAESLSGAIEGVTADAGVVGGTAGGPLLRG